MAYVSRTTVASGPRAVVAGSYSTTFPTNENPISEGGAWGPLATTAFTKRCFTTSGNAFGDATASGTNDAVAILTGTYFKDQTITATLFLSGGAIGSSEVELHMNCTSTSGAVKTYECDILPFGQFFSFVKWDGAQGVVTVLPFTSGGNMVGGVAPSNGDVFTCSVTGNSSTRTLTLKQNGVTVGTADDTLAISGTAPFITGNPGIGFDNGGAQNGSAGWADFAVVTTP